MDDAVRQRWPKLAALLTESASSFGDDAAKELEVRQQLERGNSRRITA